MYLVRDIMHCKPGQVRPMVERTLAMAKLMEKHGMGRMRVLTDFCAERYWTIVMEMELPSLQAFDAMMKGEGQSPEGMQEMEKLMKGYHELVLSGRREMFRIEG